MSCWPFSKKEKFDDDKVLTTYNSAHYEVEYCVYEDNEDYTGQSSKYTFDKHKSKYKVNTNKNCFAQLPQMLTSFSMEHKKWPNRLSFLVDFKKHGISKCHLTSEEIHWWVETCKKHKFLPDYISKDFVDTGNFILKIDILDLRTMYIYLILARHLQEEPYFVRAVRYLVIDRGIDFFTAFTVASRCCISNTSHHVINLGKTYPFFGEGNSINLIKEYNLDKVTQLKSLLDKNDPDVETPMKNRKIGSEFDAFSLHTTLQSIKVTHRMVKLKDLVSNKKISANLPSSEEK